MSVETIIILQILFTAASIVYQQEQAKKMREAAKDRAATRNVRVSGSNNPIPIVYGYCRISNPINVFTNTSSTFKLPTVSNETALGDLTAFNGDRNETLITQHVLSSAELSKVVWADIDDVTFDDTKYKAYYKSYVNKSGNSTLSSSTLGRLSTATFNNLAYSTEFFKMNRDEPQYQGKPNVAYYVQGKKIRTITNGVLSTSRVFSNNTVLVLLDYLLDAEFGPGMSLSDIDLNSFETAILVANQVVRANAEVGGKIYEKQEITTRNILRHEFNGTIYPDKDHAANIAEILNPVVGCILFRSSTGKLKLSVPNPEVSTISQVVGTINDTYLIDDINYSQSDTNARANQVKVAYANSKKDFAADSYEETNTVYKSQDNNVPLIADINYNGVTNVYQAEGIAKVTMNESRVSTYSFKTSHECLIYEPGDIVLLSSDFNDLSRYIRITNIKMNRDFTLDFEGLDYDSSIYSYTSSAVELPYYKSDFNFQLDPPKNITVTPNETGNSAFGIARLDWEPPESGFPSRYIIEYTTALNPTKYVVFGESLDTSFNINGLRSGSYIFHVRSRSLIGKVSARSSTPLLNFSPKPPLNLTFTPNFEGVYEKGSGVLSWITSTDTFFRRFLVEYSDGTTARKRLGYTTDTEFVIDLGVGTYNFYVSSESFSGEISESSNLESKVILIGAPRNLTFELNNFVNQTQSMIVGTLQWESPTSYIPNRYIIEYRLPSSNEYKRLGNATGLTFEVSGLTVGTYVFSVRSESVRGLLSERIENIATDLSVPNVDNLSYVRNTTNSSAKGLGVLSWDPPANYRAKQYLVEYTDSDNNTLEYAITKSNSVILKGIDKGTYNFIVKTESFTGDFSLDNNSLNIIFSTPIVTDLAFLYDLNDTDLTSVGTLRWFAPKDTGIDRYLISDRLSNSENEFIILGESKVTFFKLGTLKSSLYDFSVIAVDVNGLESSPVLVTNINLFVPSPTNIFVVENTSRRTDLGSGTLSWSVPNEFNFKEFIVEYKAESDTKYNFIGKTNNSFMVIPQLEGGNYTFYVTTVSQGNELSEKLESLPFELVVDSPTGISFLPNQNTENSISLGTLTWAVPVNAKPKFYTIEYKTAVEELLDQPGDESFFKPLGVTTNNQVDVTNLKQGNYVFSIISESKLGIKSDRIISGVISIVQQPPTGVTFTSNNTLLKSGGNGALSWTPGLGLVAKEYLIEYRIESAEEYEILGTTSSNTFVINNIDSDIEYEFSVTAVGYNEEKSIRSLSEIYNFRVPTVIDVLFTENITYSTLGLGVLSWKPPQDYQPLQYIIDYSINGANQWQRLGVTVSTSFIVKDLSIGSYDFAVSVRSISLDVSLPNLEENIFLDDGSRYAPGISLSETLTESQDNITTNLLVSLTTIPSILANSYEVQYQRNGEISWTGLGRLNKTQDEEKILVNILNVTDLTLYYVRARTISVNENTSSWNTVSKNVVGKTAPPLAPTVLNSDIIGSSLMLSWEPSTDVDLSHYIITYDENIPGGSYATSITLIDKIARPATSCFVPAKSGKYFIKSIDKSGHISLEATETVVTTNLNYIENLNVISQIDEDPSFSGTRDATVLKDIDNYLYLDATNSYTEGYYYFSNTVDLGAIYTSKVSSILQFLRLDSSGAFDSFSGFFDLRTGNFDGPDYPDDIDVSFEIRYRNINTEAWSNWKRITTTSVTTRYMEFRIKLISENNSVSPQIRKLGVAIDMPDRVVSGSNITSGTNLYSVIYSGGAFKEPPSIGIATQNMVSGDYYTITLNTTSGFSIVFKNSANTIINRTFDYVAKGYGKVEQ